MSSSFEQNFCGNGSNGEFWNLNVTWYTENPDFTPCFHKTIFAWSPTLIFLFFTSIEISKYLHSDKRNIPWNFYNVAKLLMTAALVVVSIVEIVYVATTANDTEDLTEIYPADYIAPVVFLLTYAVSFVLLLMSLKYGIRTSPAQFYLYFSSLVCGTVTFRSILLRRIDSETQFVEDNTNNLLILYAIQFSLVVFLFIANLLADAEAKDYDKNVYSSTNPCPRLSASYFSKLIYAWAVPLMWTGYRRPLQPTDLWDLDPKMTSRGVVPYFDQNLARLKKGEKSGQHYNDNNTTAEVQGKKGSLTFKSAEPQVSVFPAMLRTFGTPFFVGSAVKIIYDTLAVFNPQFMKFMIGYVDSQGPKAEAYGIQPEELWKGIFYAMLLLVVTTLQSILLSQYFERMFVVGMNLRTSLISTIYRKALRMNSAAKKDSTVGEIVNLMSVDAQRFMDLIPYLNMLWSAPLQIALCCYFMYQELGPAIFSGVAVMILTIPINTVVAKISRGYQLEQMKNKDKRTKLMNEIIGGVKVLKLYGWEPSFMNQVLGIRDNEITVLKKSAWLMSFVAFIWTSVPFMVALASFATYVFMDEGNVLNAEKAFVTMSYLNIMRMPMAILPFMIIGLVQAGVSLDRVNKFMNNSELDPKAVDHDPEEVDPIVVEEGTFKWGEDEPEVLKDISFRVKKGSLTAVVGTVGAGKSSLISALLGEMVKTNGRVNVLGSIAFVPQQAWMQNVTLKENILFGKVLNNKAYERAVDACALVSDIAILPGGDQTEIGEKGINLSGGQKQRVALARAVYSNAETYLLDDPLSAVDAHVGKHIFDQVIGPTGELAGTTRLLVTHGITYLPKCDQIIVIKNGSVSEQGSYQELLDKKGAFADFLIEFMSEANGTELIDEDIIHQLEETLGKDTLEKQLTHRKDSHPTTISPQTSKVEEKEKKTSVAGPHKLPTIPDAAKPDPKKGTTLIEKETVETGSVKMAVYFYYMRNIGIAGCILSFAMQLIYQGSSIGTNYWLNFWAADEFGNSSEPKYRDLYLGVYGALGFVQAASVMILTISLSITTLDASKTMHKTLLDRVMRSPMSFFDTTPLGRIVNRFAKDIDICDNTLPTNIRQWLSTFANFVGTIILIVSVVPFFGAVIVPVAIAFYFVQSVYVSTSRQLKRLESVSRSPIYSHFGETLNGTSTIRAFGLENQFILQSEKQVDTNHVCYYPSIITNRWLAVWLENIGNLITVAAALFAILDPESVDPSEVGLIITYALNVTQVLNWLVRMTSDVETNIVAVERIKEYAEIEQEANWDIVEVKPPKEWPQSGAIQFKNYGMRYREGLDLVVKGIDCEITGGEMIGIVGRTGAGKSSLTVALFRLVEAAQGSIIIDDLDISKLGLHDLRTKLTIIPQDPVLFSGSLRINLDPFQLSSDEEVWNILKLAHLHEFVSTLEAGLEHEVSEGGGNLSVGQRQLICLARALLRKTKVLILDEATAAVDLETDELIQSTIRKEFKGCTVLTIAHRLNTILDYDRIIVMDKGIIAEFDSPTNLLQNKNSIFYSMIKDAGLANS